MELPSWLTTEILLVVSAIIIGILSGILLMRRREKKQVSMDSIRHELHEAYEHLSQAANNIINLTGIMDKIEKDAKNKKR